MRWTKRVSLRVAAVATVVSAMFATGSWAGPAAHATEAGPTTNGYLLLGGDGAILPFGIPNAGSAASDPTRCPIDITDRFEPFGTCWSVALTPDGKGYWILNGDTGVIYTYGDAGNFGDPAARLVGVKRQFFPQMLQIVSTPDGKGYWIYHSNAKGVGTIGHFGDAGFFGDSATLPHQVGLPIGIAPTGNGQGYWEVRSDGGVFGFGNAKFYGSMGGKHLAQPIIGITATADGKGYWLVASDGGVFAFGDAVFAGSLGGKPLNAHIIGLARNPAGPGYWLAAADGGVFAFGGAPFLGSAAGAPLRQPVFAIAAKTHAIG